MLNSHIRILVVDDEPISRTIAEGKLLPDGYTLFFAINGVEALKQLPECTPHVILMDVMMPEMDGFTACERIKGDPRWESIPIIMVTALDDRNSLRKGFAAGANDFISKAASTLELRARVRSMVKIKQQYDELARLLTLREDMSNMVVHDMRNPLTSIIGYGQLLAQLSMTEKDVQGVAGKIVSEGRRLGRFIDDMLLMAKMEENELRLNRVESDVGKLMQTTIDHLKVSATAKDITFDIQQSETPPAVRLDVDLFQRVMDNLVTNAIKYSPIGSTIQLQAIPITTNGVKGVRIAISDEGDGIPDPQKESIFQKFDIGRKKNDVLQIGLGLAFSKMVVDAHNGTLRVEDNHPQGSIFVIEV